MQIGIAESRFDRVVGKAATEPLVPDNPAHPSNRRLSVIMLRGTGADNPVTKAGGKKAEEPEALPGLNRIRNEQAQSPGAGAPSRPAPASGAGQVPSLGLELDQNISR